MLADWDEIGIAYRLFIIDERWGIRDHTVPKHNPPVLLHRCDSGRIEPTHDLTLSKYKCNNCNVSVPKEVQAVFMLGTWNYDER